MASPVRIVHAAQCRLDVPPRGFRDPSSLPGPIRAALEDAALDAFDRLIERTRELNGEILLLVGNTLRAADRSLRARRRLEDGMRRLDEAGIHSVIVPGPLDPASVYGELRLPKSAAVLSDRCPSATVTAGHTTVSVRLSNGVDGVNADEDADITIAAVPPRQSNPAETDRSAKPRRFDPRHDLGRGPGVVYWALGEGVSTSVELKSGVAHDPGPLSPTSVRTKGACGATLVEIDADGAVHTRSVPCGPLYCESVEVSVTGVPTLESLAERMSDRLPTFRDDAELTVVNWDLTGSGPVVAELTAAKWRDVVELVDDEAGRERLHQYQLAGGETASDEIAAMLVDEFEDRLAAGDLDPRDESEEVESPGLQKVLADAAASPRTADRTRRIGAAVFAENCGKLWDAA